MVKAENCQNEDNDLKLSIVGKDILKTLLYFDIFKYPLKAEEILINSSMEKITLEEVNRDLDLLTRKGVIRKFDDLYKLEFSEAKINERILGNIRATRQLK